jgi:rod shape-determining protein MreD
VLALLVNDRIILLWIISLRGEPLPSLAFWAPPVVGTAIWPWLFLLLDRYRGVMRQRAAP